MKKVFVIFAVAAMFVACQKPAATTTETTDSTTVQVATDTTKVDSAAVATVDTAKVEVKK